VRILSYRLPSTRLEWVRVLLCRDVRGQPRRLGAVVRITVDLPDGVSLLLLPSIPPVGSLAELANATGNRLTPFPGRSKIRHQWAGPP